MELVITSFNTEGIISNLAYTRNIALKSSITCLQEHWLLEYEKNKIDNLFPEVLHHSKSVDEELEAHEDTHSQKPRGHGGVCTLWKRELDQYAFRTKEGNNRIVVTLFDIPKVPICVINCYLPSGVSSSAVQNFEEDLDTIHELTRKYEQAYNVLIIGDLNADHYSRELRKEKYLAAAIQELELHDLGQDTATLPTYINHNLKHRSRLDHALVKPLGNAEWERVKIESESSVDSVCNSSTHMPIRTSVKTPSSTLKGIQTAGKQAESTRTIYKWKEADTQKFAEIVAEELMQIDLDLVSTDHAFNILQNAIHTATAAAVPGKAQRRGNHKQMRRWSSELAAAVKHSKLMHYQWKQLGRPQDNHPAWRARKRASRSVRRVQRVQAATSRAKLLTEISEASYRDPKLFSKLVQKQRTSVCTATGLMIEGKLITAEDEILNHWADYYEALATPKHEDTQEATIVPLLRLLSGNNPDTLEVSTQQVRAAVANLNNNKAPDRQNICAEQLKLLPDCSLDTATRLFNRIFAERTVPESFKQAYKLPIPKKGKDNKIQDNHRGITIAPIFGKLLEILCLESGISQDICQNELQFGFTGGRSPTMASLVITEAIAEARATRTPLYVASLDAKKAFDVVDHDRLRIKLFNTGINRRIWSIIDDLYVGGQEVIRIGGAHSREYVVRQGVKQGGILSPSLYKLYISDLLDGMRTARMGLTIGTIYLGTPACADDVILASSSKTELNGMIGVNDAFAERNRYELHCNPDPKLSKSSVTALHVPKNCLREEVEFKIRGTTLPVTPDFTHLGLNWRQGAINPDVQKHVTSARRTAYSLLGAGLHGRNGLDPAASFKLITLYVIPTLLYGLEATILRRADFNKLETFYRGLLRQVQSLPVSTAKEAIYLLLGTVPIEAVIHQHILSFFGSITRLEDDNPLRVLALRQLALAEHRPHSWFNYAQSIAQLYDIDLHSALTITWPKDSWKTYCKTKVRDQWRARLLSDAVNKSTLAQLLLSIEDRGPHLTWGVCQGSPFRARAATSRARMLVGRSGLQGDRWRISVGEDTTCPLCAHPREDAEHLLVTCNDLQAERGDAVLRFQDVWRTDSLPPPLSTPELTQALLNGDRYRNRHGSLVMIKCRHLKEDAHRLSSALCDRLLKTRDQLLNARIMSKIE